MGYPFDRELAAALPGLEDIDLRDLPNARAKVAARGAREVAETDTTGVEIREVRAPGLDGGPEVPLRAYRPQGAQGPLPVIYRIHGGGFVNGHVDREHASNVGLSRELGALVVGVNYRLAPEHPYPAALDDCYAGLCHLREFAGDPERLVLFGTSAGGGLAAGLALRVRDQGGPPISFQLLNCPELDDRLATPSMRAFTDTPQWTLWKAVFSWDSYLGPGVRGTARVSPYAAPARATDLRGLPPTYVAVAEFDPLRDEGIDYARELLRAGVSTELHLFPGTFHGSAEVAAGEISRRQHAELLTVLRRAVR